MVLFWAVGHPGAPEIISCRRLCILSGCQANSDCCFCTLLSAWTRSSEVTESRGEGIRHVVLSLILRLLPFSFDFFPLSYSFSLVLPCLFSAPPHPALISSLFSALSLSFPPSLLLCFSPCRHSPPPPTLFLPSFYLSFVAALKKSYSLDFQQKLP